MLAATRLALEDGAIFTGVAFGAAERGGGDLVVNTSQTGYQEVCTDPSYAGQVVVMTFPLCILLILVAERFIAFLRTNPRATRVIDYTFAGVFGFFAVQVLRTQSR